MALLRSAMAALPRMLQAAGQNLSRVANLAVPGSKARAGTVQVLPMRKASPVQTLTVRSPRPKAARPEQGPEKARKKQPQPERQEIRPRAAPRPPRADVIETAAEEENARELAVRLEALRQGQAPVAPPGPALEQASAPVGAPGTTPPTATAPATTPGSTAPTATAPPGPETPSPLAPQPAKPTQGLPGAEQTPRPQGDARPSASTVEAERKAKEAQDKLDQNTDATQENTEALKQQEKAQRELAQVGNRFGRFLTSAIMSGPMVGPALSNLSRMVEGIAQGVLGRYAEVAKFAPEAQWSLLRLQHQQTLLSAQSVRALSGNINQLAKVLADTQRAWAPFRNVMAAGIMSALTIYLRGLESIGKLMTNVLHGLNRILQAISFGALNLDDLLNDRGNQMNSIASEFFGRLSRSDWHGLTPPPRPMPRFERPFGPLQPPPRR